MRTEASAQTINSMIARVRVKTLRSVAFQQVRALVVPEGGHQPHFRNTTGIHPLGVQKKIIKAVIPKGEWVNPTHNHVWSEAELKTVLSKQPRHTPENLAEKVVNRSLKGVYWMFNKITGYRTADPTPDSVAFRLIFLESIAGVPGMIAAQHRHFRSLRNMDRDYGWIHTLLEEAENERMHLLTFMKTFPPGPVTRLIVFGTQFGFAAIFGAMYIISPRTAHRTVGYIEEMAVMTYCNVIEVMQTPGSQLEQAWRKLPAPDIAKVYWRLKDDADFLDVVKQIAADETSHRDVNHTFASMASSDPNPYVAKHHTDSSEAVTFWHQSAVEGRDYDFAMSPLVKPTKFESSSSAK